MSLYLHPDITVDTIIEAKKAGITGVKSYPAGKSYPFIPSQLTMSGVTTNSSSGVVDYEAFYPVFAEMEKQNLILNLHGECPKQPGISILNAEEKFLPTLFSIHERFPSLRIILEHCTTTAALAAVSACGPTVAGTITAHHLYLTIDDVAGNNFAFCKPVAKTDDDRTSLLRTAISGDPKFFLGTDSAPHPRISKIADAGKSAAAGVFTQPFATQTVLDALEFGVENNIINDKDIDVSNIKGFLSEFGRRFYKVPDYSGETITLKREHKIQERRILIKGDLEVVPFQPEKAYWAISWS
jgi:dihydroorotase